MRCGHVKGKNFVYGTPAGRRSRVGATLPMLKNVTAVHNKKRPETYSALAGDEVSAYSSAAWQLPLAGKDLLARSAPFPTFLSSQLQRQRR